MSYRIGYRQRNALKSEVKITLDGALIRAEFISGWTDDGIVAVWQAGRLIAAVEGGRAKYVDMCPHNPGCGDTCQCLGKGYILTGKDRG